MKSGLTIFGPWQPKFDGYFMGETTLILFRQIMLTMKKIRPYDIQHTNTLMHKYGVPKGIRTPVPTVKGWCPRPLDDGDFHNPFI